MAGSEIACLGINSLFYLHKIGQCMFQNWNQTRLTCLIGVNVSKPFAADQGKPFFFASS